MTIQTTQGDLTIVGAHTDAPAVYWKGQLVLHVDRMRVRWDAGGHHKVRIWIDDDGDQTAAYAEMVAAGIVVNQGGE